MPIHFLCLIRTPVYTESGQFFPSRLKQYHISYKVNLFNTDNLALTLSDKMFSNVPSQSATHIYVAGKICSQVESVFNINKCVPSNQSR